MSPVALRSKVPGHAMLAAHTRDERRWLAAFGTFFLAPRIAALAGAPQAEDGRFRVPTILGEAP